MSPIEQADAWLFQLMNMRMVHPAADDLMIFLTKPEISGHIFMLAAAFMLLRKGKDGFWILCFALLAVGMSDYLASGICKPLFQRVRPCFALQEYRLLIIQPRSYSFASSHAANAAAIASTVWLFFRHGESVDKAFTATMIVYGLLVGLSRIYVGVHYPGDVLGGFMIGIFNASWLYLLAAWVVKNIVQLNTLKHRAE